MARYNSLPTHPKSCKTKDLTLGYYTRSRTALANQIRSIAAEYGVIFPKSLQQLRSALPEALEDGDNELSTVARRTLWELAEELRELDKKREAITRELTALASRSEDWQRLQDLPSYGPIIAAAVLAALGSGKQFRCGRDFAAWLGLVPRQQGSGDRMRLLGITKNGDRELRTLLIHGARSALRWAPRRDDPLARWVLALKQRRGHNKAVVALANKCARIAWRVVRHGETFDVTKAAA